MRIATHADTESHDAVRYREGKVVSGQQIFSASLGGAAVMGAAFLKPCRLSSSAL